MNRRSLNGERGRLGCTDRRLTGLDNSVHRHGCSAGRPRYAKMRSAGRLKAAMAFEPRACDHRSNQSRSDV